MRIIFVGLLLQVLSLGAVCAGELTIRELPIFDKERMVLTREYNRTHYGRDTVEMETPRMIVVHFTTMPTLKKSVEFFRPTLLSRKDIRSGGAVNVSAHYLVDRDGTVYRMAPDRILCRHTIGFNHVALGIENVGRNARDLTPAQLAANAALIDQLLRKFPSIDHLIGHHEYRQKGLPHLALHRDDDSTYQPTVKNDPGKDFMKKLRSRLKADYGRTLLD